MARAQVAIIPNLPDKNVANADISILTSQSSCQGMYLLWTVYV